MDAGVNAGMTRETGIERQGDDKDADRTRGSGCTANDLVQHMHGRGHRLLIRVRPNNLETARVRVRYTSIHRQQLHTDAVIIFHIVNQQLHIDTTIKLLLFNIMQAV